MAWRWRDGLCAAVLCALVLRATAQECDPGSTGPNGGPCVSCEAGKFKPAAGIANCSWCGQGGDSTAGSVNEADCACAPGHTGPYRTEAQSFARMTLAGSGEAGRADGMGTRAKFTAPRGIAYSPDAAFLAVSCGGAVGAERAHAAVRLVHAASGNVSTLAGGTMSGFHDGVGTAATFGYPADATLSSWAIGVAYSPDGAQIAVADQFNHAVRLVRVSTGEVSTLLRGLAPRARSTGGRQTEWRATRALKRPPSKSRLVWLGRSVA